MIAVSIVSYNTSELLKNCLRDLGKQKSELDIWVLDNNSPDDSAKMVEGDFPKVHLIKSDKNLGFAKGHNLILKNLRSEFVLILNPDTQIPEDSILKMKQFMEANPDCAISSCQIKDYSDNLSSNGGDLPFGLSLLAWLFNLEVLGIKSNFHRLDKDYFKSSHEVGWVGGTFLFARLEALKKAGYFNEDYFMYFEDTELCFIVRKNGGKIMINPEVAIRHKSGASLDDPRFRQWTGEFKGLIYFYKKYFGFIASVFVKILIDLSLILRVIAFIITGKISIAKTYVKVIYSI